MSRTALRPLEAAAVASDVTRALAEDIGSGDVSADLLPQRRVQARLLCREQAVLAGTPWFEACIHALDARAHVQWLHADGDALHADSVVCDIEADSRALLSAERTAINFLQTLSATATATAACVAAVGTARARILDTRKTLPGLRLAQKYAVRCGGGENHRMGLYDMVLLKENHLAAAGGIGAAVQAARALHPALPLVIEVETLAQLDEALVLAPTRILLDNFDLPRLNQAVQRAAGRVPLEASGGLDLAQLAEVARSGVDFISVGALTKHVRAVDFSLRVLA